MRTPARSLRRPVSGRSSRKGRARGLSLLELVVVVGLLALLAGALLPGLSHPWSLQRGERTRARFDRLEAAVRAYAEDTGLLPPDLAALALAPPGAVGWDGPYASDEFDQAPPGFPASYLLDGYGRPLAYARVHPFRATLSSDGANGTAGDGDDFVRTIDAIPEFRRETVRRLRVLNAVSGKHAADFAPPSTASYAVARAALLAAGYLNDDPRYAADAFGEPYLVTTVGAPALRVTSPVFCYSTDDPAAPLPPAPRCAPPPPPGPGGGAGQGKAKGNNGKGKKLGQSDGKGNNG